MLILCLQDCCSQNCKHFTFLFQKLVKVRLWTNILLSLHNDRCADLHNDIMTVSGAKQTLKKKISHSLLTEVFASAVSVRQMFTSTVYILT